MNRGIFVVVGAAEREDLDLDFSFCDLSLEAWDMSVGQNNGGGKCLIIYTNVCFDLYHLKLYNNHIYQISCILLEHFERHIQGLT